MNTNVARETLKAMITFLIKLDLYAYEKKSACTGLLHSLVYFFECALVSALIAIIFYTLIHFK